MKYIRNLSLSLVTISGLIGLSITPVVFARAVDISVTTAKTTDSTTEPVEQKHVEDRIKQNRQAGQTEVAKMRENKPARTPEQRKQVCETRKISINNRLKAYDTQAETKLTRFNAIFTRVKAFKPDVAAKVSNYDQLVAIATQKQMTATESVTVLSNLTGNFDCTTLDPAATIASIKDSTVATHAALKEYGAAIKNIVVALAQANKTTSKTTNTVTSTTTGAQ